MEVLRLKYDAQNMAKSPAVVCTRLYLVCLVGSFSFTYRFSIPLRWCHYDNTLSGTRGGWRE